MSRSTSRSMSRNQPRIARPDNGRIAQGQPRIARVSRVERVPRVTELDPNGNDEAEDDDDLLDDNGKFKKGHGRKGGRKKGQQNKMTRDLKQAVLLAAQAAGRDGEGLDGLIGYLTRLAIDEPKSFAPLLGRMIPLHIGGSVDHNHRVIKTKDEIVEELKKRGLLIEGTAIYERLEDWRPAIDDKSN